MTTSIPTSIKTRPGRLYLVPTPLDFGCQTDIPVDIEQALPRHTLQIASRLDHWITENAKSTRAFLKRVHASIPLVHPLQNIHMQELPREIHKKGDHTHHNSTHLEAQRWLAPALAGHDIGLVSEAGMPAIADPGSSVVRAAHSAGIEVQPLVGPISLMMALAISGLNGQSFAFAGYLPQDPSGRAGKLRSLEQLARTTGQAQIFIETPYRNQGMLQTATEVLRADTWLAVAFGLMVSQSAEPAAPKRHYSAPIHAWKKEQPALDTALPAVFIIGA